MMYEYKTSFDDFKKAQILAAHRSVRAKVSFYFWLRVAPVFGLLALGVLIWDVVFRHFGFDPIIGGILAGVAWIGIFCAIRRPFLVRKLYRQMLNGRPDGSPLELGIEGDQLVYRVPGRSEGRYYRASVNEFVEDADLALLFVTKKNFLMVPKRALPQEAWQQVNNWLSTPEERPS
jgi:hypothetical protein